VLYIYLTHSKQSYCQFDKLPVAANERPILVSAHEKWRQIPMELAPFLIQPNYKYLSNASATDQIHDTQQNDSANKGGQQCHGIKSISTQMAATKERTKQETAQNRANAAYDNVQKNTLLCIGPHNDAGEPTNDAAHDKRNNEVHPNFPFLYYFKALKQ
jgi:hypothetical protein